jgi:hypothetical protein
MKLNPCAKKFEFEWVYWPFLVFRSTEYNDLGQEKNANFLHLPNFSQFCPFFFFLSVYLCSERWKPCVVVSYSNSYEPKSHPWVWTLHFTLRIETTLFVRESCACRYQTCVCQNHTHTCWSHYLRMKIIICV